MIPPNPESRVPCQHPRRVNQMEITDAGDERIDAMLAQLPSVEDIMALAMRRFESMLSESVYRSDETKNIIEYRRACLTYFQEHPATKIRMKLMALRCPNLVASLDAQSDLLDSRGQAPAHDDAFEGGMQ